MKEQWQELKETIIELRDNDGTCTQQEVCKFLVNYMGVLEEQMVEQESKWIPVSERLPTREEYIESNGLFIVSDGNRSYAEYFDIYDKRMFGEPTMEGFRVDRCVSAWMPLPKPYEPQESEDKE